MASPRGDVLIKGGLLVSGQGISRADVLVAGEQIAQVGPDLSGVEASRTVDAAGRYVLPGAIDAHCHPVYSDKMDQYTVTAAYGGITTVIAFVGNVAGWGFSGYTTDLVKGFIEEGERISHLDFSVHGTYTAADEDILDKSIPELMKLGVISFKMFLAYKRRGMAITEDGLLKTMDLAAGEGGLPMVHCENACCIDYLVDSHLEQAKTGPEYYPPSQPTILEAEGLYRASTFSQVAGSPLYSVHLSAKESIPLVREFRDRGVQLFTETCPHYLALTDDEMTRRGPLAKVGPPLRKGPDREALWQAVADGTINVIASDSGGRTVAQKIVGGDNIFDAPHGLNTIEFMMPMVWTLGVNTGRISLPRMVQVFCENPAKVFGLYPKKGVLQPGSDADLVIWDPAKEHTVDGQHGNTDHSAFDGFELLGMPELTMQRGRVVMEKGEFVGTPGAGGFLPGDPDLAAYSPTGYKVT